MSRKTARLTLDNLDELPGACRRCLFWQLDPVRRGRLDTGEAREEKQLWVSEVLREWGSCGQVILQDDRPLGHIIYAPAGFLAGAAVMPTAPVSTDALQLATVYVDPLARGGGLGRVLIQAMARDLVKRGGILAVEAFGDSRPWQQARSGGCVVPTGFLSAVGFKTQRAHPMHPRMRMELRSTVTWKDEVEQAVERLLGAVRPTQNAPKPAQPGLPPARSLRSGGSE